MEDYKHWAEDLQTGDIVYATIRHKTDGKLNRHNVSCIVISSHPQSPFEMEGTGNFIVAYDIEYEKQLKIPYCELYKEKRGVDNIQYCYKDKTKECTCSGLCRDSY